MSESNTEEKSGNKASKTEQPLQNEHKIDMDAAYNIKQQGNSEYIKKNYKVALKFYEQALKCINIELNSEPPPSLIKGTNTEYYKEILNKIELNSILQDKRNDISKIFSNRAACFLNLKDYISCIHNSNISLLYNPNNENGLYRRAYSYEKLDEYVIAMRNYKKLLTINDKNKKAFDGLFRVNAIIKKQQDRINIYTEAINKLKCLMNESVEDSKIVSNIASVMNQIYYSEEYHKHIIKQLGFTHILYEILLTDKYSFKLKTDCIHALNGIIKHCTDNEKFSQENQLLITNGFESKTKGINYTKMLIEISKQFLGKLINIFENKKIEMINNMDNEQG
eukprot:102831_1